jgi:glutamate synthase (NADPH) GltB2 subunit (EC 1.4.1.13)
MKKFVMPEFMVDIDYTRCNGCGACVKECSFGGLAMSGDTVIGIDENCVNCLRCMYICAKDAIKTIPYPSSFKSNYYWRKEDISDIEKQASTGSALLTGMGNPKDYEIFWDKILINASQVTNPPIDPLREPMELTTYLGSKPDRIEFDEKRQLLTRLPPQLKLKLPIMFAAMSFGAISYNAFKSLAIASEELGIYFNTGEGGMPPDLYDYGKNAIVQVASGRFGVNPDYLNAGAAVEIKIGQGAKPGIGGHLPGTKVGKKVSETRMIPEGTDAISPAPHHDIYSIEDLKQLIYLVKEVTGYTKPIIVKIAAVNNSAAIASGIVRAGADIIAVDGFRGGTGAAPKRIRDNVGIPIEFAISAVDQRLKEEGLRDRVSIVASGGIRNAGDVIKALALGADAVYIGTAALIAMGCKMCMMCTTGKCAWGIATQKDELAKRLNPEKAAERLINMINGWEIEIKDILGGMGMNMIEALRGNRHTLRGLGFNMRELKVLGIKAAGE